MKFNTIQLATDDYTGVLLSIQVQAIGCVICFYASMIYVTKTKKQNKTNKLQIYFHQVLHVSCVDTITDRMDGWTDGRNSLHVWRIDNL